jgi:hypothetical protein
MLLLVVRRKWGVWGRKVDGAEIRSIGEWMSDKGEEL